MALNVFFVSDLRENPWLEQYNLDHNSYVTAKELLPAIQSGAFYSDFDRQSTAIQSMAKPMLKRGLQTLRADPKLNAAEREAVADLMAQVAEEESVWPQVGYVWGLLGCAIGSSITISSLFTSSKTPYGSDRFIHTEKISGALISAAILATGLWCANELYALH